MAKTLDSKNVMELFGENDFQQNVINFFGKKNLFFDRLTLKIFKKLHETRNFFI